MKEIIAILSLFLFSFQAHAAEIICFSSNAKVTYRHYTDDVRIAQGFYIFHEQSTGKLVYISGDCVVKYQHESKKD